MASKRPRDNSANQRNRPSNERDVVVILERAGLMLGRDGLVDAYDRAASTEIANPSLKHVRPDIVHQCLLALFDSSIAYRRRLKVYLSTTQGKVIEISPQLRPPRTYGRFKGLMAALLREGNVTSKEGVWLMRTLPGTVAPLIPHQAPVIGLSNSSQAPVKTACEIASDIWKTPVDNSLQGGEKNVLGFFVIPCTEDLELDGIDYVTKELCLSVYPLASHVACSRVCEGVGRLHGPVRFAEGGEGEEGGDQRSSKKPRREADQQQAGAGSAAPLRSGSTPPPTGRGGFGGSGATGGAFRGGRGAAAGGGMNSFGRGGGGFRGPSSFEGGRGGGSFGGRGGGRGGMRGGAGAPVAASSSSAAPAATAPPRRVGGVRKATSFATATPAKRADVAKKAPRGERQ